MATKLMWALSLTDHLSAPASKMGRAMAGLERQIARAQRTQRAQEAATGRAALRGQRFSDRLAAADRRTTARMERGRDTARARALRLATRHERAEQRVAQAGAQTRAREAVESTGRMVSGVAAVGAAALAAGAAVGHLALAFGSSAVDAIRFREQAMTTLRQVLQSDSAAQDVFRESQAIARQTPFETQDVVNQRVRLIAAGFSRDQSRTLQASLLDIRALFGDNSANQLTNAFERIRSGGLTGEVLEELRGSRVGTSEVIDQLARTAGISAANPDELQRRVLTAARTGRIQNSQIIGAILDRVQSQTHSTTAGAFARQRGATSFAGATSNLSSAFGDLLASGNIDQLGGTQALVGGLNRLVETLSDASPVGTRLRTVLYGIVDAAGQLAGGFLSGGSPERMLGTLVTGLERVWNAVNFLAPLVVAFFRGLGRGLAPLAAVLGRLFGGISAGQTPTERMVATMEIFGRVLGYMVTAGTAVGAVVLGIAAVIGGVLTGALGFGVYMVTQLWSWIVGAQNIFSTLGASIARLGGDAIQGFVNGITAKWQELRGAVTGVFTDVAGAAASALRIQSPSRVFMELGGFVGEGFALGLEGSTGGVSSALNAMVQPPEAGAAGLASGAAGGRGPVTISITVDGSGSPADTARAVAAELAQLLGVFAPETP